MKTVQPRFPYDQRKFSATHNPKSFKSVAEADFEKILFWHLLYKLDAYTAVFVLNPANGFRLVFGIESLCRTMKKTNPLASAICISDCMPALTLVKLGELWSQVGSMGSAAIKTDFMLASGKAMAVDVSLHAHEFSGQKMLVGYLRDAREPKLADNGLRQLQGLLEQIARGAEMRGIFEQIALSVESTKPGSYCSILILDENRTRFQIAAAPSLSESYRAELDALVASDRSGCNKDCVVSALMGKRQIRADIGAQSCGSVCQQLKIEIGAAACWSEPIFSSANRLLGIIRVYLTQASVPDDADLALLRQASHLSSLVIEREGIKRKSVDHAGGNSLAGSHNRHLIGSRLREQAERCNRQGLSMALLFINLDHFKEVNVALGFQLGDQLLAQAEERIRGSVRDSDAVVRLAGDEFVVIIPPYKGHLNAGLIGEHIVEALAKPFQLDNSIAHISASVGIAYYPEDADDIDQLLDCADQSMYAVKKAGRNGVNFFTRSLHSEVQDNLQLSNDLRGALQAGQFKVYFQPIVNILNQHIEKAEALIRWQHPERGMVSPDQFIPIAEEIGEIHEIGDWVFRQAAEVAIQWQRSCLNCPCGLRDLQVSVNMSPLQFMHGTPDVLWIDHLRTIGLNPKTMVIEITEGSLLNDRADVMEKLGNFRAAGMQIAMDDFGTGYSAMAYLKKFDIHYLKIDRSFVRDLETDPGDLVIAEAIIVMAHRLGLKVIAEGVETQGQRDRLAAVGCDYLQGYLYAKPMSAEDFLLFVQSVRTT
ncbi:EAL domain-containing protein [Methylomonas sp. LL1]|uniref:putative bifunctional diguanylate cyclase/phosphodiesterase n=1 Tax=Methylomonas sp. LL1 TaxID=2785785 RepID=UPI0018C3CE7E|nr:GGDEF domain-containing protein [Methylomonas sp. LL1]QPK64902.1 EAL domain-containing protein [Methylomonas sp. LL1]